MRSAVMLLPPASVLFSGAKGAIMFDLGKLNESLKAGTDRVCRILGRDNLRKVEQNGWKGFTQKDTDADSRDCEKQLRDPDGR